MSDRVYWTADRSTLVEEGDARAAFLAYAAGDPIAPEHRSLLGAKPEPGPGKALSIAHASAPKPAPVKRATRKPKG